MKITIETFKDDGQKEWVESSKNWIEADDDIVTLNSKESFAEHNGKTGVIKLTIRATDKTFKVTLSGFHEGSNADDLENIEF